jgi:hypothetical protein
MKKIEFTETELEIVNDALSCYFHENNKSKKEWQEGDDFWEKLLINKVFLTNIHILICKIQKENTDFKFFKNK